MGRGVWIEQVGQDLAFAVRTLRRSPAFVLVAVLSLALGIGANTAIFSLIHALLLRELPVQEPSRLVAVGDPTRINSISTGNLRSDLLSFPLFEELRRQSRSFTGVYASGRAGRVDVVLAGAAEPETARCRLVSGGFFSVLGVPAFRGRTFTAEDDRAAGGAPFVVMSHAYWRRRFAEDPQILGRKITLNGHPFSILGVAPPGFSGDTIEVATEIWIPLSMQAQVNPGRDYLGRWDVSWLLVMGRLQPGVSLEQARTEMNALFPRLLQEHAGSSFESDLMPRPEDMRVEVTSGAAGFSALRRQIAQPLFLLMVMVALVLLVACANVAHLLLERALARGKEIAVRLALGAGRARLIRQLLTESVLLSGTGGLLGLFFATWAGRALLGLNAGSSATEAIDLRPDLPLLAFTAAVALGTGLLFGLAPALRATRVDLTPTLKQGSRSVAGQGGGRWPLGKLLVAFQIALSLLLLTGSGLFVRTLQNLERLDLGYARDELLLVGVDPVGAGYDDARLVTFPGEIVERLRTLPGVSGVTFSANGIFSGSESSTTLRIEGFDTGGGEDPSIFLDSVGPAYFRTIGLPLRSGREIEATDVRGGRRVAVINEAMAAQYFAGRSPIGRRLVVPGPPDTEYEIVGVAADSRDHDLRGPVPPRFYGALLQNDDLRTSFNLEIRTTAPDALVAPVREALRAFDPGLPTQNLAPLARTIDGTIATERIIARLSAVFGLVALGLAAIGLYGVISYAVARRTNEIGIRLALGARRAGILWLILRETLLLTLAGAVLGLPVTLGAARAIESRLFGLTAADPATLTAAFALLLLVALGAGLLPGLRATRLDPLQALRAE